MDATDIPRRHAGIHAYALACLPPYRMTTTFVTAYAFTYHRRRALPSRGCEHFRWFGSGRGLYRVLRQPRPDATRVGAIHAWIFPQLVLNTYLFAFVCLFFPPVHSAAACFLPVRQHSSMMYFTATIRILSCSLTTVPNVHQRPLPFVACLTFTGCLLAAVPAYTAPAHL